MLNCVWACLQLNLPNPYDDHFQPLMFRVSSNADPEGVDLLPDLYRKSRPFSTCTLLSQCQHSVVAA